MKDPLDIEQEIYRKLADYKPGVVLDFVPLIRSTPDHQTDANAQFEAWRGLNDVEKFRFREIALSIAGRESIWTEDAFNRHFCEIFLRTKNLWK